MQVLEEQTVYNTPGIAISDTSAYLVSGPGGTVEFNKPYTHAGSAIRFDPRFMPVGEPYPFAMLGMWFMAVKRAEGHIDFFHLEF